MIQRLMAQIEARFFSMLARGVIKATKDDKALQRLQMTLLSDETTNDIERMQEYGFASRPLAGAEALALFLGGQRTHGVVIATEDRRYRLKPLAEGEVALYTDEGDFIHFKRNGELEIQAGTRVKVTAPTLEVVASTKVLMTTPLAEVTGNLKVGGNAEIEGNTQIGGNTEIGGTLDVSGASTLAAVSAQAVSATSVTASGAVVGSTVAAGSTSLAGIKSTFNSHTHNENGTGGGVTNGPNSSVP